MGGAASAPWRPSDYGLVTGVPEKLHCAPAEPRAAQTPNNGVFPPPRGSAPSSGAQGLERTRAKPRPPRGPAHLRAPVQASILVCGIFFFFFWRQICWSFSRFLYRLSTQAHARRARKARAQEPSGGGGPRLPTGSPGPGEEEKGQAMEPAAAAPGKMAAAESRAGGASHRRPRRPPASRTRGSRTDVRVLRGRRLSTRRSVPPAKPSPGSPRRLASASRSPQSGLLVSGNQLPGDGSSGCGLCGHRSPEVTGRWAEHCLRRQ